MVIDDPESIIRCTNKVYLAELVRAARSRDPRTLVVARATTSGASARSSGCRACSSSPTARSRSGVVKAPRASALAERSQSCFAHSELAVAQEFMPTEFDWRIGVLDRKPLYACRYYMAPGHWQVVKTSAAEDSVDWGKHRDARGRRRAARASQLALSVAPS